MSRKSRAEAAALAELAASQEPVGEAPVVAIVGRPNVGKSALFNRLIGAPVSIVEDVPGVTRDRIYGECAWNRRTFMLVDTGGMVFENEEVHLRAAIMENARKAVEEAAVVLFVVDATAGIHGLEEDVAELLRRSGKPVLLVANKVDSPKREIHIHEFHQFGLGDPWPVSAIHGDGTGDLLDEVVTLLPAGEPTVVEGLIRLAIVGRPNVGKSSLLNRLLGEERSIVDAVPGTTRDAVDTRLDVDGQPFVLVDTAGLRRPARVDDKVEYYSTVRSHRAIKDCDIALLVMDAEEGVSAQDKRIAGYVQEARKGIIVVINKWDLVRDKHGAREAEARKKFAQDLFAELNFMSFAPLLFVSAKSGENVHDMFGLAKDVYSEFTRRLETAHLNRVVREAIMMRPPPTFKGQQLKVFYASQKSVAPPQLVFKVNSPKLLHFSYRRYLENHIRRAFGLIGTPIELVLRA